MFKIRVFFLYTYNVLKFVIIYDLFVFDEPCKLKSC